MLRLEFTKNVLYIEGVPAFVLHPDGEKEWVAPDGVTMYFNNKEFVDKWLKDNLSVLGY